MCKEYLKMADVFTLPVKDEDRESAVELFSGMVCAPYSADYTVALSQYAAHAINSHDELVAEVERLREHNKNMRETIDRMSKAVWGKQEEIDRFRDTIGMTKERFIEQYCCFHHPEQK